MDDTTRSSIVKEQHDIDDYTPSIAPQCASHDNNLVSSFDTVAVPVDNANTNPDDIVVEAIECGDDVDVDFSIQSTEVEVPLTSEDLDNILDNIELVDMGDDLGAGGEFEDEYDSETGDPEEDDDGDELPALDGNGGQAKQQRGRADPLVDTLRQLGELSIAELPPVPQSEAEVGAEECEQIGTIATTLGTLIMVETIPNKPAYDIDTLLFLENGKRPLGYIFDVMGPVTNPMYAIRFNTEEEIAALNINVGMSVYSAPQTEHTRFVFVQQLLKEKGSDASWKNDIEVPQELLDYSDDEAEHQLHGLPENRKRTSVERHRQFEDDMNMRNLIDSRMHRVRDYNKPKLRRPNRGRSHRGGGGNGRGCQHRSNIMGVATHPLMPVTLGVPHAFAAGGHSYTQVSQQLPAQPQTVPAFHAPAGASQCAYNGRHQAVSNPYGLAPYSMQPMQPMPPYVPMFIPPLQFGGAPPPQPSHLYNSHGSLPMVNMPQSSTQTKANLPQPPPPAMMYPPDMGLPPVQQNPPLVPNMQYFNSPVMWGGYPAQQPPPPPPAPMVNPQPVHVAAGTDMRPQKKYYRTRRK